MLLFYYFAWLTLYQQEKCFLVCAIRVNNEVVNERKMFATAY